jgi:hypothetical protein
MFACIQRAWNNLWNTATPVQRFIQLHQYLPFCLPEEIKGIIFSYTPPEEINREVSRLLARVKWSDKALVGRDALFVSLFHKQVTAFSVTYTKKEGLPILPQLEQTIVSFQFRSLYFRLEGPHEHFQDAYTKFYTTLLTKVSVTEMHFPLGCSLLDAITVATHGKTLQRLAIQQELYISKQTKNGRETLGTALAALPAFTSLTLSSLGLGDAHFQQILEPVASSLTSLDISGNRLSAYSIKWLASHCRKLESLNIANICLPLSALAGLPKMPLKELIWGGFDLPIDDQNYNEEFDPQVVNRSPLFSSQATKVTYLPSTGEVRQVENLAQTEPFLY